MCRGCGIRLGLKLISDIVGKRNIIITKPVCNSISGIEADNPFAMASGFENPLCFADENATEKALPLLLRDLTFPYVCYNTSGVQKFARLLGLKTYSATASLAFFDDFANKLNKAMNGGFIELLTPCPAEWVFDSSNTVMISRFAIDCGLYPLYEIENKKFSLSYKPKLEPLERFLELHRKKIGEQEKINRNWKLYLEGRIWEI